MTTTRGERSRVNAAVARAIRAARARTGLTQKEVAARGGLPRSTYIRCETNEREITLNYLAAIARGLGVTPQAILSDAMTHEPEVFAMTPAPGVGPDVTEPPKPPTPFGLPEQDEPEVDDMPEETPQSEPSQRARKSAQSRSRGQGR